MNGNAKEEDPNTWWGQVYVEMALAQRHRFPTFFLVYLAISSIIGAGGKRQGMEIPREYIRERLKYLYTFNQISYSVRLLASIGWIRRVCVKGGRTRYWRLAPWEIPGMCGGAEQPSSTVAAGTAGLFDSIKPDEKTVVNSSGCMAQRSAFHKPDEKVGGFSSGYETRALAVQKPDEKVGGFSSGHATLAPAVQKPDEKVGGFSSGLETQSLSVQQPDEKAWGFSSSLGYKPDEKTGVNSSGYERASEDREPDEKSGLFHPVRAAHRKSDSSTPDEKWGGFSSGVDENTGGFSSTKNKETILNNVQRPENDFCGHFPGLDSRGRNGAGHNGAIHKLHNRTSSLRVNGNHHASGVRNGTAVFQSHIGRPLRVERHFLKGWDGSSFHNGSDDRLTSVPGPGCDSGPEKVGLLNDAVRQAKAERSDNVARPTKVDRPDNGDGRTNAYSPLSVSQYCGKGGDESFDHNGSDDRLTPVAGPGCDSVPEKVGLLNDAVRQVLGDRPDGVASPTKVDRPDNVARPTKVDRPDNVARPPKVDQPEHAKRQKSAARSKRTSRRKSTDGPQGDARQKKADKQKRAERPTKADKPHGHARQKKAVQPTPAERLTRSVPRESAARPTQTNPDVSGDHEALKAIIDTLATSITQNSLQLIESRFLREENGAYVFLDALPEHLKVLLRLYFAHVRFETCAAENDAPLSCDVNHHNQGGAERCNAVDGAAEKHGTVTASAEEPVANHGVADEPVENQRSAEEHETCTASAEEPAACQGSAEEPDANNDAAKEPVANHGDVETPGAPADTGQERTLKPQTSPLRRESSKTDDSLARLRATLEQYAFT